MEQDKQQNYNPGLQELNAGIFRDLLCRIPWGNCARGQRNTGELADLQGQSPQSIGTVHSNVQTVEQVQQDTMDEHRVPD